MTYTAFLTSRQRPDTTGARLLWHRLRLGLSPKQVADLAGFTDRGPAYRVTQFESGAWVPTTFVLRALASGLGVEPEELLLESPAPDGEIELEPSRVAQAQPKATRVGDFDRYGRIQW